MNNLQIFKNENFGEIRTSSVNGEPYVMLNDVCEMLDIKNVSDVKARLKKDGVVNNEVMDRLGRKQVATFINESNLYKVIFQSRKPQAEQFTEWVTSEVLPSIRKNGGYISNQENLTPEQIVAQALIVANNIIQEKDRLLADMKPKAEYFDELVDRNLLTNFRDAAKELKVGQKAFVEFLLNKNYIYRDAKGKLKPYAEKNNGLFEVKEYASRHSSHAGLQTLITPKGRETFRLLLAGVGG